MATTAIVGCGEARSVTPDPRACLDWKDDIAPLLSANCASCHSGKTPAGGVDLTSYESTLAVARAGDPTSPLVNVLDNGAGSVHGGKIDAAAPWLPGARVSLRSWVVDCAVGYARSPIHPPGFLDPQQPDQFHGALVATLGWDMSLCQGCHAQDFSGGTTGVACTSCHDGGPTACTGCHGQPPQTGAHVAHTTPGALGKRFDCSECHVKPVAYTDAGHLQTSGHAVVTFGALAQSSLPQQPRSAPAAYDEATKACANVYCHGGALNDSKAATPIPHWDQPGAAACGGCHGLPPANHKASACNGCHPGIADAIGKKIDDTVRHLDGKLQLGDGSGTCSACHGGLENAAPPRALDGTSDSPAVGAHQAHVKGLHKLRAPIACTECHVNVSKIDDPGHIDHELPATVTFGALATTDGAQPAWDHAAGKCTNVYCHGGGAHLAGDQATTLKRTPAWSGDQTTAECGACHGVPPIDSAHQQSMTIASCVGCHPGTVSAGGSILDGGKHMNGVIDAP